MGKALATKLAQQGANVCIVARNQSKLDQAIEHIKVLCPMCPLIHILTY
jgi:3-dehydrosphinganine reductase